MEKRKISNQGLYDALSDRIQELIIFPTEQCNFRCTYCYEDFSIGRMSDDVIKSIKNFIKNRSDNLDKLQLSWFGGEPLVAKDIVLEISKYAFELAEKNNFSLEGNITTNGYNLTPKTFTNLTDFNINHYQISLDGPKDIHDSTRLRADGKGTFDRIWQNLLNIKKTNKDVSVIIRIHLDTEKVKMIDPLIEDIQREFIKDSRFSVFLKPIEKLGGKNDEQLNVLSREQRNSELYRIKKKLYGENFSEIDSEPSICYASKPNSLIIRSDGKIGKCTVALDDPRNSIGRILSNGTVEINQNLLSPWLRGFENFDLNILGCPLQKLS
ncbi:radical SAM protein [Bacillus toyonensis]|uniref:radical SAM protein n=1 Tax=Bacillus toyonensis TaxID=155322 RepID=UPI0015D4ED7B|nr:radical SAM protein [Bacillus toyonensis]